MLEGVQEHGLHLKGVATQHLQTFRHILAPQIFLGHADTPRHIRKLLLDLLLGMPFFLCYFATNVHRAKVSFLLDREIFNVAVLEIWQPRRHRNTRIRSALLCYSTYHSTHDALDVYWVGQFVAWLLLRLCSVHTIVRLVLQHSVILLVWEVPLGGKDRVRVAATCHLSLYLCATFQLEFGFQLLD